MKRLLCAIALLQVAMTGQAREYGHYDVARVFSNIDAAPGKSSITLNFPYFVQILEDLISHAATWPAQFDSEEDRQRAKHDVQVLSNLFDPVSSAMSQNRDVSLRIAQLHVIGHNLEIPGESDRAIRGFSRMLEQSPDDAQVNYEYGAFLAGANELPAAIPYLEKAKNLGVAGADLRLGFVYSILGEKAKAVEHIKSYLARFPNDDTATRLLDAVQNDRIDIKRRSAAH